MTYSEDQVRVQRNAATNSLLAGAAARLLFDAQQAATTTGTTPRAGPGPRPAHRLRHAWLEGFLRGNGLLLLHHPELFGLLDTWLGSLPEDTFREIVPLLPAPRQNQLAATPPWATALRTNLNAIA